MSSSDQALFLCSATETVVVTEGGMMVIFITIIRASIYEGKEEGAEEGLKRINLGVNPICSCRLMNVIMPFVQK